MLRLIPAPTERHCLRRAGHRRAVPTAWGSLAVTIHNRWIGLRPERDGTTRVTGVAAIEFPVGTRVEVSFGPALPCDHNSLYWANIACRLGQLGTRLRMS
jgi:hypothetical protein